MNFNKTTEYALQILSYMATDEKKLYSTNDIYKALKIPFRYLRKQMTILSKTELIESIQGKYGGYKFSKKISEISLLDIVNATENTKINNECFFGYQNCALTTVCVMHNKWASVKANISKVLKTTSLKDIKDSGSHHFMTVNNLLFT